MTNVKKHVAKLMKMSVSELEKAHELENFEPHRNLIRGVLRRKREAEGPAKRAEQKAACERGGFLELLGVE